MATPFKFIGRCPNCKTKNIEEEEVPGSHMWAYNYHCNVCDINFSRNIEDRHGSQTGDIITLNHHYPPMNTDRCPNCNCIGFTSTCNHCGFDASEIDIY